MKRKLGTILVGSIFFVAFSWESPLDQILFNYKRYLEERPQEKIYVHLDRSYYSSGETIWIKAYLVAGPLHEPSPLSQIIYIELFDQRQKVVQTTRLLADQSSAGGYISLPDTLSTGNYTIRAYTQWMTNFNEDYFFHITSYLIIDPKYNFKLTTSDVLKSKSVIFETSGVINIRALISSISTSLARPTEKKKPLPLRPK